MAKMEKGEFWKRFAFIAGLAGLLAVTALLWNTVLVYPVKVFVVMLHELSHGLAAILTGGKIVRIEISPDLGGACATMGGNRFIVLTAGYIGSLLWGGLILLLASRTRLDKWISIVIGAVVFLVTVFFVRSLFGLIYGILFGLALAAVGKFAPEKVNDFLLKFIGLTSMLYAILDIKEDLISRDIPASDAAVMGREFFGNSFVWGVIWAAISVAAAVFFIILSSKGEKKRDPYYGR